MTCAAQLLQGEAANRHAVLTATPDLIAQDLVAALLRVLDAQEIQIVAALPYLFSSPAAAELYRSGVTHKRDESRLHASWLNPRLFTAGASLILYLRARDGEGSLVERIRAIKGSSRIGEHSRSDLRSLSAITDRGFSLVHSPDDTAGVAHEIDLLNGPEATRELLARDRPALRADIVTQVLPFAPLGAETNPFDILLRVVAQVSAMCACAPMNGAIADSARALFDRTRRRRDELAACAINKSLEPAFWSAVETLAPAAKALASAQRAQLDAADTADRRWALRLSQLLLALVSAAHGESFTPLECEELITSLHACHLPPSSWDEHRLRLIAAYHRPCARKAP